MKKTIIILIALVAAFSCNRQANKDNNMKNNIELIKAPAAVGLGTLDISFHQPVALYRTENDETPVDMLFFKRSWSGVWHYKTKLLKSFQPYIMFGGDSNKEAKAHVRGGLIRFPPVLSFRVLEVNDDYYRVVLDESSFETVVIRKKTDYAVLPRRDLLGYPSLPKDKPYKGYYIYETWEHLLLRAENVYFNDNYTVYDAPEGIAVFENTESDRFKIIEISGDWIKIQEKEKGSPESWVRWKNETKILVKIIEFSIE